MSLTTHDFPAFFHAVWGYDPFPWQAALAERVATEGWPELLDLPTGTGKTATLDIALFHLALDGGHTAPRRVIMVVDRRVLVDQARTRAEALRTKIEQAEGGVLAEVRAALRRLTEHHPSEVLLETATLRGAMLRDDGWARRPDVPLLAASTVDQVGSRLLFRGYGVSDGMKPVHAGLIGCDTLLLLDEVHLSRPFASTLRQLSDLRTRLGQPPTRFKVVELSATPGQAVSSKLSLTALDHENAKLHKVLTASKPTTLEQVKVKASDDEGDKRQALAQHAVRHATKLLGEGKQAVAILVNRVDTARRAWELARKALPDVQVELLTGRMRPLDQQRVLAGVLPRLLAGRVVQADAAPVLLVTTQCIEAGADLDLDGLVTECASLDALRQRAGRVDRRGDRADARIVVLVRTDQTGSRSPDPVYGEALAATWSWLSAVGPGLDFGIRALEASLAEHPPAESLLAPNREAPVILPAWLDQWAQTNPRPHPDPDPSLCLHGMPRDGETIVADVQIVWRADLTADDLRAAHVAHGASPAQRESANHHLTALVERIAAVPPGSLEALSNPVWAAKRWLTSEGDAGDISDVEGRTEPTLAERQTGRLALRWTGSDSEVIHPRLIRPGDTLIVPADYGGIGEHGTWSPEDERPVADLGDAVQLVQRGRPTLRLDPRVLGGSFTAAPVAPDGSSEDSPPAELVARWLTGLHEALPSSAPSWLRATLTQLCKRPPRLLPRPAAPTAVGGRNLRDAALTTHRPLRAAALNQLLRGVDDPSGSLASLAASAEEATTEGDAGTFNATEVGLTSHLQGVAEWAQGFASACHLPAAVVEAITLAASLHDVGKADARFQQWLHLGDPLAAALAPEPLAKSGADFRDGAALRRARQRAGYQQGQRHELVSLDMVEGDTALHAEIDAKGLDWDLVLHLVASHHGWCRPAAPPVDLSEADDEEVALSWSASTWSDRTLRGRTRHQRANYGAGVPERFKRLTERYGAHELAWFEAILRLADHRRSQAEQERNS